MGRGAEERDILLCFRVWAVGDENMAVRIVDEVEAEAEAAMSVSESTWTSGMCWSWGCLLLK